MIKKTVAALLAALSMSAVLAGPQVFTGTLVNVNGGPSQTAGLSSTEGSNQVTFVQPGSFEHWFKFSYSGSGWVNGQILTTATSSLWNLQGVELQSAFFADAQQQKITGSDFEFIVDELPRTIQTEGFSMPVLVTGDFYLYISGWAGNDPVDVSPNQSFSYSGHIDLIPTAQVPEPASLALVLAGLGGAAWARRRRAKRIG